MNIVTISFEDPLIITINGEEVKLTAFKTQDYGNIKFGVQAPRSINIHREEIYLAIKQKHKDSAHEPS